jgi:hypothetical protein
MMYLHHLEMALLQLETTEMLRLHIPRRKNDLQL